MKIPGNAIIHREKLTKYLLVPKPKNDKSGFLARIGFTTENPELLEAAIRELISKNEAFLDRENEYGQFYQVEGILRGPAGVLMTVTVWLERADDNKFYFVTLKPARSRR